MNAQRLRWIEAWAQGWRKALTAKPGDRNYYAELPLDVAVSMIEELLAELAAERERTEQYARWDALAGALRSILLAGVTKVMELPTNERETGCGCDYELVEDGAVQRVRWFHEPGCELASPVVRERDTQTEWNWQSGEPPKHGYYLAAWVWRRSTFNSGGVSYVSHQPIVSELWFNPDAIHHWWFTRGYTGQHRRPGLTDAVHGEVIAWMPIPDAPVSGRGTQTGSEA